MSRVSQDRRPTIGVLAGWQFYRTATNLSYLAPLYSGASRAAQDVDCNLLLGFGIGPSASPTDPFRPAWPFLSPEHDFIPVGPQNTDGLIIAVPLHSKERSEYVEDLIASAFPILFIGSGEDGPTIMVDNTTGILQAMRHLVDHGHRPRATALFKEAIVNGGIKKLRGKKLILRPSVSKNRKSMIFALEILDAKDRTLVHWESPEMKGGEMLTIANLDQMFIVNLLP